MPDRQDKKVVVLITGDTLGRGDDELGAILMRSFIKSLKAAGLPVTTMLFLNGGVKLTTAGSNLLDDLKAMADAGVEIRSCGTCLDFLRLRDSLEVGTVGDMKGTVEALAEADVVIQP